jgi:hypothetical protein
MSIISAGNTVTTAMVQTADTSGNLVFVTTGGVLYANSSAGGLAIPSGTTAQRPASTVNGTVRYNTTLGAVEMYVGGAWVVSNYTSAPVNTVAPVVTGTAAQGSTLTVTNGTWTNSPTSYSYQWLANSVAITSNATANTFVLTASEVNTTVSCNVTAVNIAGGTTATSNSTGTVVGVYTATYLIIAGGASGGGGPSGSSGGGGGGAGGLLANTTSVVPGTTYSFVVGAGGPGTTSVGAQGINGSNTTAFSLTAIGGGGGGNTGTGSAGGSGGGGANYAGQQAGGAGTSGQGFAGANAPGGDNYPSGGGGGSSQIGQGINGGNGTVTTITGSSVTYAGGGGGSLYPSGGGSGGTGGGGAGGAGAATAFTGSGGGGQANGGGSGSGASGIIIISVPTAKWSNVYTGSNVVVTTSGSNTIAKFSASGSYTA